MNLNEAHKAQLSRFTTFFKGKRDRAVADRDSEKADFKSDRVPDKSAIFNAQEVESLIEAYHSELVGHLREELERVINLSAVFISQMLASAEAAGVTLQVEDISIVEDQARVDQIGQLPALSAPLAAPKRSTLGAISGGSGADPAVVQEMQDLKEEIRQLKDRNLKMQTDLSSISKERSAMATQLEQVKSNLKQHLSRAHESGGSTANVVEYERALTEAKAAQDQKQAELEAMRRDLTQRLGDSSQFRELKAIVKKKSDEIKALKERLVAAGLPAKEPGTEGVELDADSD